MKRKYIRWSFLVAFAIFAVIMRESRLLNLRPGLFIVIWLLASYSAVFGVVYFRDKNMAKAGSISAEEARIDVGLE